MFPVKEKRKGNSNQSFWFSQQPTIQDSQISSQTLTIFPIVAIFSSDATCNYRQHSIPQPFSNTQRSLSMPLLDHLGKEQKKSSYILTKKDLRQPGLEPESYDIFLTPLGYGSRIYTNINDGSHYVSKKYDFEEIVHSPMRMVQIERS